MRMQHDFVVAVSKENFQFKGLYLWELKLKESFF
jgi:hypothetical protein